MASLMMGISIRAWAADIVVTNADSVWTIAPATPATVFSVSPRTRIVSAEGVYQRAIPGVATGLLTATRALETRVAFSGVESAFLRPLTPMDSAIGEFTATAQGDAVLLTWKNRRPDFSNTLVVVSSSPLFWTPSNGTTYAARQEAAQAMTVAYTGAGDYSRSPLTVGNLKPGVLYDFAAFAFNAKREYAPGVHTSAVIPTGRFAIRLEPGLNMLALPVKPQEPLSASSLAERTAATMIVRFDATEQRFEAYLPAINGVDFPIMGGEGYILNAPEPTEIEFTGSVWSNKPSSAPTLRPMDDKLWAFAIGGIAESNPTREPSALMVRVENLRNGLTAETPLFPDGTFVAAFADLNRRSVVRKGDALRISVVDGSGRAVSGSDTRRVESDAVRNAYVLARVPARRPLPSEPLLLPNYPNPFNPETWIPFALSRESDVAIRIFDLRGQIVRTLSLSRKTAGWHDDRDTAAHWDGRNELGERVADGVYIYELQSGAYHGRRRMVIAK
jgi:hypothetical protein